ncbi:MAG: hypothetical protein WBC85_07045 [Planktotalea sp.]
MRAGYVQSCTWALVLLDRSPLEHIQTYLDVIDAAAPQNAGLKDVAARRLMAANPFEPAGAHPYTGG